MGEGDFRTPYGAAFDAQGSFAIADQMNHRVQLFDRKCHFLLAIGGNDLLRNPSGIAFNYGRGGVQIIVCDTGHHQLAVFSSKGQLEFKIGSVGDGNSQFRFPSAIAVALGGGNIHVCDQGNGKIKVFRHGILNPSPL
jgi:DNA-binding beta-propeller fold protein YncE